jgi:hypothetical protein
LLLQIKGIEKHVKHSSSLCLSQPTYRHIKLLFQQKFLHYKFIMHHGP